VRAAVVVFAGLSIVAAACADRTGGDVPRPHTGDASTGADAGDAGDGGRSPPPDVSQCDDQGAC
jgi:hypothetical protein